MVSLDDVDKNRDFAESLDADLVLLSDEEGVAAKAYGVTGFLRPFPRRWTYYIDAAGVIVNIDKDVTPATAGPAIVKMLETLGLGPAAVPEEETAPVP